MCEMRACRHGTWAQEVSLESSSVLSSASGSASALSNQQDAFQDVSAPGGRQGGGRLREALPGGDVRRADALEQAQCALSRRSASRSAIKPKGCSKQSW